MGTQLIANIETYILLYGSAALLCAISILLLMVKDHLSGILFLSALSLVLVISYSLLKAPDVAITEVAVGSALSTTMFLIALKGLGKTIAVTKPSIKNYLFRTSILALATTICVALCYCVSKTFPTLGSSHHIVHRGLSVNYIHNAFLDFEIPNIVTTILGGYRGMDTLFETTVIMAASFGVFYILKRRN